MDDADQLSGARGGAGRRRASQAAYPSYEFRHLFMSEQQLLTGEKPMVDPAVFKDKIVFIGFTASGLVDVFRTPVSSDERHMPGIQLHASMADSILANRFIRPASAVRGSRAMLIAALADRAARGVSAVHGRRRGIARDPRRLDLVRRQRVQGRRRG